MNIGKITGAFKLMGLFLLANVTAIFFLLGLIAINYAIYLWDMQWGLIATGISFILVALIINGESGRG
ncbi:hypothetical protein HU147_18545 [Planomicrobium chinense]|uniref:hypothetical protein n=1 Tax=Planococcus chinensis TaxID=272917 RepID=UPI001CC3439C|nr:hypothetical protein [Planococcus chinensis]MBZ5203206.1 hypothetical protein [Planococcus chinensis]